MTESARNKLVEANLGFVRRVAAKLKRRLPSAAMDLEDLIQEGMIGLIVAASRYDPARNDHFQGYALRRVRGAMLDSLRRRHWFEATQLQLFEGQPHEGEDEPLDVANPLEPILPVPAEAEALVNRRETARALRRAEWIELDAREVRIMDLYYRAGKTEREIAPALGVSESRVGQVRRRALVKLRRRCRSLGLAA